MWLSFVMTTSEHRQHYYINKVHARWVPASSINGRTVCSSVFQDCLSWIDFPLSFREYPVKNSLVESTSQIFIHDRYMYEHACLKTSVSDEMHFGKFSDTTLNLNTHFHIWYRKWTQIIGYCIAYILVIRIAPSDILER